MTPTTTVPMSVIAVKNSSYLITFMAGVAYLNIVPESVAVLSAFIIFDMITGMLKSGFLHGPTSIKSSVWERGLVAKGLVIFIPFGIALAGKGINVDLSTLAQSTINVFILSELYSIVGNIYAIKTGTEKVEFDAVAWAIGQVKDVLKKFIRDDETNLH